MDRYFEEAELAEGHAVLEKQVNTAPFHLIRDWGSCNFTLETRDAQRIGRRYYLHFALNIDIQRFHHRLEAIAVVPRYPRTMTEGNFFEVG
jgi:hypothetical protein